MKPSNNQHNQFNPNNNLSNDTDDNLINIKDIMGALNTNKKNVKVSEKEKRQFANEKYKKLQFEYRHQVALFLMKIQSNISEEVKNISSEFMDITSNAYARAEELNSYTDLKSRYVTFLNNSSAPFLDSINKLVMCFDNIISEYLENSS